MRQAAIENRLTGHIKPSGAAMAETEAIDDQVRRTAANPANSTQHGAKMPTPSGLSPSDAQAADSLKKSVESSSTDANATPTTAAEPASPAPTDARPGRSSPKP